MSDGWAPGGADVLAPSTVRGDLALLHDAGSRVLVGVVRTWTAEIHGTRVTVSAGADPTWAGKTPPSNTPLRLALVLPRFVSAGIGIVQSSFGWQWRSHEPLQHGPHLLDDWSVPTEAVPLPHGHTWYVRTLPRHAVLQTWRKRLEKDGATLRTWGQLIAAYDGGWTLPEPSPGAMRNVRGWRRVPTETTAAVVNHLVDQALTSVAAGEAKGSQ